MREHDVVSQPPTEIPAESGSIDRPSPAGSDPIEDDHLLEILARWEERYRRDEDVSPESLGVEDPELIEALR